MSDSQTVAAFWALTRAFTVLCHQLELRGILQRTHLAEAIQEDYLHEQEQGRTEEFLAAYRSFAVQVGPVPDPDEPV